MFVEKPPKVSVYRLALHLTPAMYTCSTETIATHSERERESDGCRSVLCADGGREALGFHSAGRTGVPLSSQSWKSELDHCVCN